MTLEIRPGIHRPDWSPVTRPAAREPLLANAIATGGALVALILAFAPQSGAHLNRVVTLALPGADPDSAPAVDYLGHLRLLRRRAARLGVVRK